MVELEEKDDLMENEENTRICGYLGTRNLVQTSFVVQYIVSVSNLLNAHFLTLSALPVSVGFLFEVWMVMGLNVG